MVCPDCGSIAIGKEVTRRGWSGDYVCLQCGCSNAKDAFESEDKSKQEGPKWKLKKRPPFNFVEPSLSSPFDA